MILYWIFSEFNEYSQSFWLLISKRNWHQKFSKFSIFSKVCHLLKSQGQKYQLKLPTKIVQWNQIYLWGRFLTVLKLSSYYINHSLRAIFSGKLKTICKYKIRATYFGLFCYILEGMKNPHNILWPNTAGFYYKVQQKIWLKCISYSRLLQLLENVTGHLIMITKNFYDPLK